MTTKPMVSVTHARKVFDVSQPWLERALSGQDKQMLVAVDDGVRGWRYVGTCVSGGVAVVPLFACVHMDMVVSGR